MDYLFFHSTYIIKELSYYNVQFDVKILSVKMKRKSI